MLIQSSLPSPINTALSFASDHEKQQNTDLLCDWSHCSGTWQNSSKCDECPQNSCRKSISTGEETSSTDFVVSTTTWSELTTVNMCASSAPKRDNYVYKRRKLHMNSVAFLKEENATESTKPSGSYYSSTSSEYHPLEVQKNDTDGPLDNGNPSISGQHHLQESGTILSSHINGTRNLESALKTVPNQRCFVGEEQVPAEAYVCNLLKSASDRCCVNDSCSSSKSNLEHRSTFMKTEVDDTGECSSSDIVVAEPFGEFNSAKELCIYVLKSHGLLGGVWTSSTSNTSASLEVLGGGDDAKVSHSCKICGLWENPLKMLICDLCEEAFHLSCCNPRIKKLPIDEWYCQPCFRQKRRPLLECTTGKLSNSMDGVSEHRKRMSRGDLGPVSFMLKDNHPYASGVRIGKDFQADVLDWSGPISDDHDYFGEPLEMDPAEYVTLDGWNCNKSSKPSSIGNWVQCREVIYNEADENDEGIVCGKWRRAPLFLAQTDDWDCSCSVLWDPIHADCAVPQELETEEVRKHLKYIDLLRPRLANKKAETQPK